MLLLLLILVILSPTHLLAQVPSIHGGAGILDCGGSPQNAIGWEHARGVFVPVSENAVAHNTNVLVYKECVLDVIAVKMRNEMVASMTKSTLNWVNSTQDGEAAFVTNYERLRKDTNRRTTDQFTSGARTEVIFEPFRDDVRETLARGSAVFTNAPENIYKSTIPDNKKDDVVNFLAGRGEFSWDTFLLTIQPQNNPVGVLALSLRQLLEDKENDLTDVHREVDQGDGFKPRKHCEWVPAGNGLYEEICNIVTPGSSIRDIVNYTLMTGQRQTENADEMGELVGSLMSNIHNRIITSSGGLRGISNSDHGPSYLDLMVEDSSSESILAHINVGLNFLARSVGTERDLRSIRLSTIDALYALVEQLHRKEDACWVDIVTRAEIDIMAEAGASYSSITENIPPPIYDEHGVEIDPTEYDIEITAGSDSDEVSYTLFKHADNSSSVIKDHISPLLDILNESLDRSDKADSLLNNLQAVLTSSNTQNNTSFVIDEINQLIQTGSLHSASDLSDARTQHNRTITFIERLYNITDRNWDDGWCNPDNWRGHIKN